MRYPNAKKDSVSCGIFAIIWLFFLISALHVLHDEPGAQIFSVCCLVFVAAVMASLAYRDLGAGVYAQIVEDGIHIISRQKGELSIVPWEDALECRHVYLGNLGYGLMLVFRDDPSVCVKSPKKPNGLWFPSDRTKTMYRLNEVMFRLGHGKMTPQELHDLPVLIFSTNTNVASDDEFETYHSMWQAAKNRAAKEQEMKP